MCPYWLWITKTRQNSFYHGLYIWCSSLVSISMSLISIEEPTLVCSCHSVWLPVLTIKWALFPWRCPEAASLRTGSHGLHPPSLCIWLFRLFSSPYHVLVMNYFSHLPKSVPISCNQLKHGYTPSVHIHSTLYVWLPRIASPSSPIACKAHLPIIISSSTMLIIFTHITFSIFWILFSERFPEVKLLRQRPQILL